MMKKRKAAVFALFLAVCVIAVGVIPSLASDEVLLDNTFEDSSSSAWSDLTGRGIKTIESEESGNQYLALTSSNGQYYDYRALKTRISGLLFFDFDIKFTSGDMGVQIRDYTDRSANGSVMAARIEKYAYYLQYFSENQKYKLLTPSGDWLQLRNTEPWYHMQMVLDTTAHVQSIYLTERDTGTLLGLVENIPMTNPCDSINYFAVSSTEKLCVDNVKITQADITRLQISGETYPKASSQAMSYRYQCKGVNKQGGQADAGEVVWSLQKPVNGVSISAKTGVLTIQPNTPPQPVMIMVVKKNAPSVKGTFLVDIEH